MTNKTQTAIAAVLCLAIMPAVALSQTTGAAKASAKSPAKAATKAAYKPPHLADGRPDLGGFWENSTMTPLERPARFGDRRAYTEDEVRQIEGDTAARNVRINAPTDPKVQEDWAKLAKGPDTLDECRGGSTGVACGYNAGWTDPGVHFMRVGGEARTSLITYPANGRVPAPKAGAAAGGRGARAAAAAQGEGEGEGAPAPARGAGRGGGGGGGGAYTNPEDVGLAMRCIMSFGRSSGPIMLSQLYNNNYQFVQGKDTVAIWVEMVHDVRIIRLNARHRTDGVRPYMGDSIGHYEGDTLVVETTNFPASTNLNGSSANLTMIEKFTRVGPNRLHYQFEARDPTVWDQPWGGEYEFNRSSGVYEYACHEGNYAIEGVLAGARAAEKAGPAPRADAR